MRTAKQYKSEAFAALHESMEALHRADIIDKKTMKNFDDACLEPVEIIQPNEIKALRQREHVSQPVFARYLNVSRNLVYDWERGTRKPGGPALRLLNIVKKRGLDAIA